MPKTSKKVEQGPVTGLGETMEQITALCETLAHDLAKTFGAKKLSDEQREAAYKFGTAERRHRKLARKVNAGAKPAKAAKAEAEESESEES